VFEESRGFGEGFALEGESGLVFPEYTVDSSRAYGHQLFPDGGGGIEGRPQGDIVHLLATEGRWELPAFISEERPDQAEGGDNFIGADFFALPFGGFEFDRRAFHEEEGVRLRQFVEKARGVLSVFVSGNPVEFIQDG
jgi:hypothetical protein